MRTLFILASAMLCATAVAIAQDVNQGTPAPPQQPVPGVTSFRGCLTAGGDQFKLTTDIGARVLDLDIDKKTATPFIAHEVELQGVVTGDTSFRVERIFDIADHCGHSGQTPVTDINSITPKRP